MKAETKKKQMEKSGLLQNEQILNEITTMYNQIYDLGYRRMPKEMYLNWLVSLKTEREKYENKNIIK